MKGIFHGLIWLLALALITAGMAYLEARPAVAATCPACFGLEKAADGIYVESNMAAAERSRVLATVAAARTQAGQFYGGLQHTPRILVCADDACYERMGGMPGTATGAVGAFALEVSHLGAQQQVFLSAGLSRAELYGRIGFWKFSLGAVPMWFDEGLAVVVADDTAYILPPNHRDRCLTGALPDMPGTPSEWQEEMQQEGSTALYAQSACKVDMWMTRNGGPKAATDLLAKIAAGQEFNKLFPAE